MRKTRTRPGVFAVCIDNVDYPASLESRKLYQIVPDDEAASSRQLRVIDESGEDYLYPSLERVLRRSRGHPATRQRATRPTAIRPA